MLAWLKTAGLLWLTAGGHIRMSWRACQVGIVHDIRLQELRLFTDYGRCCRPLFIVDVASQHLRIKKADIRQLQDAENVAFGWQVGTLCGLVSCFCGAQICVLWKCASAAFSSCQPASGGTPWRASCHPADTGRWLP